MDETNRPKTLQFQKMTTMTRDECLAEFDRLKTGDLDDWKQVVEYFDESTIWNAINGTDSYVGDSGATLVVHNNNLISVVSWSIGCAKGYPNVYHQLDWNRDEIKAMDKNHLPRF